MFPNRATLLDEIQEDIELDPVAFCGPAKTDHDWWLIFEDNDGKERKKPFSHDWQGLLAAMASDPTSYGECSWCGDTCTNYIAGRTLG